MMAFWQRKQNNYLMAEIWPVKGIARSQDPAQGNESWTKLGSKAQKTMQRFWLF